VSAQLAAIILLWQTTIARGGPNWDKVKNKVHFGHTLAKGIIERNETDDKR
jgi:hypothetical protein